MLHLGIENINIGLILIDLPRSSLRRKILRHGDQK